MRGPWQNILAEEQFTIDVEIFDLRAIVTIDVGEDRANDLVTNPVKKKILDDNPRRLYGL
jgi:hypothetical protein